MKRILSVFTFVALSHTYGCSMSSDESEKVIFTDRINNPCSTFVTQFAPSKTPSLIRNGDNLELHISFTPSKDKEVGSIIATLKEGAAEFLIANTNRKITGLRISKDMDFVVQVDSQEHAESILTDLCFEDGRLEAA